MDTASHIREFLRERRELVLILALTACLSFALKPAMAQQAFREATTASQVGAMLDDCINGDFIRLKLTTPADNNAGAITLSCSGQDATTLTLAQERSRPYVLKTNITVGGKTRLILRNLILEPANAANPIVKVEASAEIEVFDCRFQEAYAGKGIEVLGKATVEGCEFVKLNEGVSLLSSGNKCFIRWCYLDRCYSPIKVESTEADLENNLIVESGYGFANELLSNAMTVNAGTKLVRILHNTVWDCAGSGLTCTGSQAGVIEFYSNIFAVGGRWGIRAEPTNAIKNDYEDVFGFFGPEYWSPLTRGPNSLNTLDPGFVGGLAPERSAGGGDFPDTEFELVSTSPCIGEGGTDGSDIGRFGPASPLNIEVRNLGVKLNEFDRFPLQPSQSPDVTTLVLNWGQPRDYALGEYEPQKLPSYEHSMDGGAFGGSVTGTTKNVTIDHCDDGAHVVAVHALRYGTQFYGQPTYFIFGKADTTTPVITLTGNNPLTLEVGTPYVEPGYSAADLCQGDLTGAVVFTGSVDHNVPGEYTLHYNVTDAEGIPAEEKTRTVFVAERPSVLGIQKNPDGSVTVRWSAVGANFVYTLEFCESLTEGNWSSLPGTWPKTDTEWTDTGAPESQTMRFYRVKAEGQ